MSCHHHHRRHHQVQGLVSDIKMYSNLLSTIPAFVCVSFLGPLSDQVFNVMFIIIIVIIPPRLEGSPACCFLSSGTP